MLSNFFAIYQGIFTKNVVYHLTYLVSKEWKGPCEQVKTSWKMEWLFNILVLFDVHLVIFDQNYSSFVLVGSAVVRG